MLELEVFYGEDEVFEEESGTIQRANKVVLQLEHSLVSLSKWESKFEKPFLDDEELSLGETLEYVRCMDTTGNVDNYILTFIDDSHIEKITEYIAAKSTATWFSDALPDTNKRKTKPKITSELIYYWMFSMNIDIRCEEWHLNRLLTLVRVFNVKNSSDSGVNKKEVMSQRRALNEQRKASLKTRG